MNRFTRLAALILVVSSCSMFLTATTIVVPSGTWAPTGDLSETRAGAAAVLLSDGVVLVTGGSGPAGASASAERYAVSGGIFVATAPMLWARENHTATSLHDGRVLVVGGTGADGAAVAGAEIYDPATNAWQPAGTLLHARARHTATLLPDGRVLVAGGENIDGALATMEVYSTTFEEFLLVATPMTTARVRHAAAVAGEKVLIAGGWDGAARLASVDVYDPATDSVAAGSPMLGARADHTATTLLDGNVLVAGGSTVEGDLATAEVFDAAAGGFVETAAMGAARRNHLAILLPHNNSVLIAGGSSDEAASATAELYRAWQDGGIFVSTGSSLSARNGSTGSALSFAASSTNRSGPADGLVLVAGGEDAATAELFGFATVKTDKDDYAPGMTVRVSGSGWQANQSVTFYLRELPAEHYARLFTIEADGSGNIAWTDLFLVEQHHLGVRFLLTAGDGVSQAQTTFTDARQFTATITPTVATVGVAQAYTLTVTNTSTSSEMMSCIRVLIPTGGGTPGAFSVVANDPPSTARTWTTPAIVSGAIETLRSGGGANDIDVNGTVSITFTTTATAAASQTWTVEAFGQTNCNGNKFVISGAQPVVTVSSGVENQAITVTTPAPTSAPYGSSFGVAATGGGSLNPVVITTTGVCSGGGNNSATITMTSGVGICVVHYNQAGNAGYNPAPEVTSNTNATRVDVTVTASSHTVTYGDAAPTVTASYLGFVNSETEAVLTTAPTCATTYVDGSSVAGSPYPTTCTGAAAENYTFTHAPGSVTVLAASITVTASSHIVTYGDDAPAVTAGYAGFVNSETDAVLTTAPTCTTTYVDGSSVAGSPYATSCSGAAAANYTFTYNPGSVTVLAASVTVTASSHTVTYGDVVPDVTASYAGFVNSETDAVLTAAPTCTTTYVDGSSVAGSPYPTSCTGAAAANYTFTYAPGGVTVLAVTVTVTASSHTVSYGDDAPTVTASYAGFVNGETETVLTTAPACTTTYVDGSTVAGSPYPTSCSGAAATNYTFSYTPGGVTVLAASVTVTASSHTVNYGDAAPDVTAGYAGFVNGETESVLTTAPTCSTTYADGSSVAGSPYPTSCTGAAATNYTFTYTPGSVTVTAASVTVTASSHTVTYGDDAPTVTASYAGFVNSETETVLTTAPTCTTTYADGSSVASSPYPTTCEGAAAANYTFTYAPGGVTVNAASVAVTASSHTVTYGDAAPTVTASYAGFVNGETDTVLTASPICATTYVDGSPIIGSPYPTSCSGAAAANYTFTYTGGGVTVLAASVSVTASSHTVTYGDAVPTVTASYGGFVNGETSAVLTASPICATTYVDGSAVAGSPYPTSCTGAAAANYTFIYTPGGVDVLPATVTVAASSHSVTYGDAAPAVTPSFAGFVNGETNAVLTAAPVCSTVYVPGSPVAGSPYATSCGGAAAANYVFSYTPGSLAVIKKALIITASSPTITFNDPVPAITPAYSGFVLGENHTALTAQPICSTTYTVGSLIGTYPSSCGGAASGNYQISYVGGTVTVLTACSVFNGFLPPVGGAVESGTGGTFADPVRAFKLNSTIPVKFSATCFGAPLVSGIHTLQATKASNSTTYDTPIDATPTDAATVGNQFRLTGMEWHFNLSTKAGMSQGKWLLKATLFDGSSYSVWVEIKK